MINFFFNSDSWIEGAALRQLDQTVHLPGMIEVAGLPDLHPGKGCAVGTAAYSKDIIYPHLVGNDLGCGYSLFTTDIPVKRANIDRLAEKITGIDSPWEGDHHPLFEEYDVKTDHTNGLGSIGGGNHFAELQKITSTNIDIDPDNLVLLIHSGSRSLGEDIFRTYASVCGKDGLQTTSEAFSGYMRDHDTAVKWAFVNRLLIAQRLMTCLRGSISLVTNIPHNFIEPYKDGFLHRKGSAPSDRGLSPLPGSRGTPTYLLKPTSNAALSSLAHGAGRKIARSNMHDRVTETSKQMERTAIKSVVVCGDDKLLREEHQSAYKSVDRVLSDLEHYKLAESVASFLPVLTYKSERVSDSRPSKREKEDDWRRERHKAHR